MSLIEEKSFYKTPIVDILKIFALYDLLSKRKYNKIYYFGNSVSLCKTLLNFVVIKILFLMFLNLII